MARQDKVPGSSGEPPFGIPKELLAVGEKQMEAVAELQKQMQTICEEAARYATDRVKAETNLTQTLAEKLTAAKSPPEAAQAYQDWLTSRMRLFAEDGQRVAADTQKLLAVSARLLTGAVFRS